MRPPPKHSLVHLSSFDGKSKTLNAVIETPRHSRNKFDYDPEECLFRLGGVLPEGMAFPQAFGFVPSTLGDDGDPVDVLVLMDEPVFPGCLVPARLLGVIRAVQTERDGTSEENDRLVAIAVESHDNSEAKRPEDLGKQFIKELEQFFVFYNKQRGKKFEVREWKGPKAAERLVAEGQRKFRSALRKRS